MGVNKEPYIFISYSHKDRELINPFISALNEKHYVWFDEGLNYGREWEEEIASKVCDCSLFIFAITENSLNSPNCKDELYLARDNDKNFLNIIFSENIDLPSWFKLRYGRHQMCYYNRFPSAHAVVEDLSQKCEWIKEAKRPEDKSLINIQEAERIQRIRYVSGAVYIGEIQHQRHGKGKYVWPDGEYYEGEWANGVRHGKGKYNYTNGSVYIGDFTEDTVTGKGRMEYPDGRVYDGDWVNGLKHGKGKLTCPDGTVYDGDWEDDDMTGKTHFVNPGIGVIYDGEVLKGRMHGKGRLTYSDGRVFEGEWENDKFIG